jgi:hypothetical protein
MKRRMKKIPLGGEVGKGKYTLVDEEEFGIYGRYKWYIDSRGYVRRSINGRDGKVTVVELHKAIAKTPKGLYTDHKNRNKLDNRRENLRVVTNQQNSMNRTKLQDRTSLYKGVSLAKGRKKNKWKAGIMLNDKTVFVARFEKERWAAMAYDIWAKDLFGEYAVLNFTAVLL